MTRTILDDADGLSTSSWRPASHIHYLSYESGVVILDAAEGEWVVLNELAGELWRNWAAGTGTDETLRTVAVRHPSVSLEDIRADALHLHGDLVRRRYLRQAAPGAHGAARHTADPGAVPRSSARPVGAAMADLAADGARPRPGWLPSLLAFVFLSVADVLLRCSFRRSLALVGSSRRTWCRYPAHPDRVSRTVEALHLAARWYPGRAACLEQSLAAVLVSLAVRRRLDWCLGSAPDPYRFHAWVAVEGNPVLHANDDSGLDQYDLILTV